MLELDGREARGTVPAVDRAVRILKLLADKPDAELGVSNISRELQLNKSTVHGIVTTLSSHGFLERDPGSLRYRPGPSLLTLAAAIRRDVEITAIARPALEALLEGFGETVFLAVMQDQHLTLVDKAESRHELSITSPLGRRLPHSAGALGKAFHAWMSPDELRRLLGSKPLRRFTARTIVDTTAYLHELARVRATGVAYDDEEYLEGVRAVAAPIFDRRGAVVAALCVVGPSARLSPRRLQQVGRGARQLALSVSQGGPQAEDGQVRT